MVVVVIELMSLIVSQTTMGIGIYLKGKLYIHLTFGGWGRICTYILWVRFVIELNLGSSQSPKQDGLKRPTPWHIIIKMTKLKDEERILKATRKKQVVTYKGAPSFVIWWLNRNISGQKGVVWNIQGDKKVRTYNQGYITQLSYHLTLKRK